MSERELNLFRRYPGLRGALPWRSLGDFPTPVERMASLEERLSCSSLYIKRDDLSSQLYGGNKVRKLEFTLADAAARARNPVITIGAVGSNHVLATTIHGRRLGLDTIGLFAPQPVQEYLRTNILCNCAQGCRIEYVDRPSLLPLRLARVYLGQWLVNRRRPYLLWIGGSSPLGVLGYVEGALEIAAQVEAGQLPEPGFIFCPVGSAGTIAGLILGARLAGLSSTVVGVRVVDSSFTNEKTTARLVLKALRLLRSHDPSVPDLEILPEQITMLHDYAGSEYARFTRPGLEAINLLMETEGIKLEGTYSGKAMAGMIDFMSEPGHRDAPALFINTYNSRPLEQLLAGCSGPEVLPAAIHRYFEQDLAPIED